MSTLFRLESASLGYNDGIVLNDFSWVVGYGERWAIVGPNGAGKTTLMRSLLGLIPLQGGELQFFSHEGKVLSERPSVGYLPQINNIDKTFPISVEEVLTSGLYGCELSLEESKERIRELLELIGLSDYAPRAIGKLSGGQLQRVLLARALASQPTLIVLDEPTSFLDKRYKEQFIELLNKLSTPEATILMVTHDLPESEQSLWQICSVGQWG